MKKLFFALVLTAISGSAWSQQTFKAGWNTYQTGMIIHEFTYNFTYTDSIHLYLADSNQTFVTPDSMVAFTIACPLRDKNIYKTANYFNAKKLVVKKEDYKGDDLQGSYEWKYDDKNRKILYTEDNRISGNKFKKNYDYVNDKKTGECIITENSYYNGKIEFYTKSYYDKNSVKYKEVRLNDNNKDIVHVETYSYGENGKVKERSVYFPEFKVTKKFPERAGTLQPKCFKAMPMGTIEKPNLKNKIAFIKKVLAKNQGLLFDKECDEFEYKMSNGSNCEIVVCTTKVNNQKQVTFRLKEKI